MPKRKDTGCTSGATPGGLLPKGQKLASLKQSALFNGISPPYALRPSDDAGGHAALDDRPFGLQYTTH